MKALLLTKYGEPPLVTLGDIADPVPAAGQVLVRVHAAGLNPIDVKLARGWMSAVMNFELPTVLGWDMAGVVEAAGPDTSPEYGVGQAVMGSLGPPTGTAAELVVSDAAGPWLVPKPQGLPMVDAAAIPMVGLTALTIQRALTRTGVVLIIGASGGIGAFLVPLLRQAGITVLATGSGAAVARLRQAGAHAVIDYRNADVAEQTRKHAAAGADAVIDLVSQFDDLQSRAALVRPGGQLLSTLFGPDPSQLAGAGVELTYVRNSPRLGDLEHVAQLVVDGTVRPLPGQVMAFADPTAAFERLSSGAAAGKIVLDLAGRPAAPPGAPGSQRTEIAS